MVIRQAGALEAWSYYPDLALPQTTCETDEKGKEGLPSSEAEMHIRKKRGTSYTRT